MTTPNQVFKSFDREDLLHIIKYRNIEVVSKLQDEPDKDLVKLLVDDVTATGLQLMFENLTKETLVKMTTALKVEYPGYEEAVKPSARLMAKRLVVAAGEASSAKHFLTHDCLDFLPTILDDLELEDVDAKDKEKAAKAILAEANSFAIENCLSAFSVDLLKRFAAGSNLVVHGGSREKILSALMERNNMDKPKTPKKKKKKVEEQPSESKPKIAKGISKVDLNSWYYAADLAEWCKDHDLPSKDTKKNLVKMILDHFDGKEPPKKPEKKEKPEKKKVPKKRRTRAPIGQAKRPKRKPKKKKAAGEAEGAPPAKKARTTGKASAPKDSE
jgi:hypothetical protein